MMIHTALFINVMRKQLKSTSNLTISRKLSKHSKTDWKKVIPSTSLKEIFENLKDYYEQRLQQRGYNKKLSYTEENNETKKKSRKSSTLWFNPPYRKSVETNIGKLFLRLINKHFPPTHKYRKVFYRNAIKISYSCMPKVK